MPYKIEKSADGQWQWKTYGDNGECTAVSETYTRRADAKRGYRTHQKNTIADANQQGILFEIMGELGIDLPIPCS